MFCLVRTSFRRGSWGVAVTRACCAAQTVARTRSSWFHARTCLRCSGRCLRAPFVGWLPLVVHRGQGCLRLFTVDNPRGLILRCLIVRPRPMLAGAARCVLQYIACMGCPGCCPRVQQGRCPVAPEECCSTGLRRASNHTAGYRNEVRGLSALSKPSIRAFHLHHPVHEVLPECYLVEGNKITFFYM
jgi:hypothetical protein